MEQSPAQSQFFSPTPTPTPIPSPGYQQPSTNGLELGPQTFIIFILGTLLLLSFLGINIFTVFGDGLNWLNANLLPSFYGFFGMVSYSAGDLIYTGSDVAADAAKVGIDLAEGAVQSVGGIAKGLGEIGMQHSPELRSRYKPPHEPRPDTTASEIQSGSGKGAWCLVGDVKGVRNCLEVDKETVCASGQVFPDSTSCLKVHPSPSPSVQQPEMQQPEMQQPEMQQPEMQQPEMQQPEMQQPEMQQPEMQQQAPLQVQVPMDRPVSSTHDSTRWQQQRVFNPSQGSISEAERQAQELLQTYV